MERDSLTSGKRNKARVQCVGFIAGELTKVVSERSFAKFCPIVSCFIFVFYLFLGVVVFFFF